MRKQHMDPKLLWNITPVKVEEERVEKVTDTILRKEQVVSEENQNAILKSSSSNVVISIDVRLMWALIALVLFFCILLCISIAVTSNHNKMIMQLLLQ